MADTARQKSYVPLAKRKALRGKVKTIMGEFKRHDLHSGSPNGPKVTDPKQAIAIALNQSRRTILGKR